MTWSAAVAAALGALATIPSVTPAAAQFYKGKTLTLIVNYGVGGNIDTEARILARHLPKHIAGAPTIIIQNTPGAGGLHAMNLLGLNIKSRADGLPAGFFTISPTAPLIDDPAFKIKMWEDYLPIGGATGWTVAYARRDTPPGLQQPADIAKATKVFFGGYSRGASHDTRIRLALEVMNLPYQAVTGFPSAGDINKAFQQNEINMTSSSLPAYQSQVVPNIINTGIGMPLWHYAVIGADGPPNGKPALMEKGNPVINQVQRQPGADEAGHSGLHRGLPAGLRRHAVGREIRGAPAHERHRHQTPARVLPAQGRAGRGRRRAAPGLPGTRERRRLRCRLRAHHQGEAGFRRRRRCSARLRQDARGPAGDSPGAQAVDRRMTR